MSQTVVFVARYESGAYDTYTTGIISIHRTPEAAKKAASAYQEIELGHWPFDCHAWVDEMSLED